MSRLAGTVTVNGCMKYSVSNVIKVPPSYLNTVK